MIKIYNSKITSTFLGPEDHGIMTFYIHLESEGFGQAAGGYQLDTYQKGSKFRIGSSKAIEAIRQICETAGAKSWENLPGRYVRIESDDNGFASQIIAIGHIVNDKWFKIKEHFS